MQPGRVALLRMLQVNTSGLALESGMGDACEASLGPLTTKASMQSTSSHVHGAGDYRDQLPPSIREVAEQYAPVVVKGRWTHGLFDCWVPKIRPLKAAVHIPCW